MEATTVLIVVVGVAVIGAVLYLTGALNRSKGREEGRKEPAQPSPPVVVVPPASPPTTKPEPVGTLPDGRVIPADSAVTPEAQPEAPGAVDLQKVFTEIRRVDGNPSYGFGDRVKLTLKLVTNEGDPAADRFIEVRLFYMVGEAFPQLKGGPPPGFEAESDRTDANGEYTAEFIVLEEFHGREMSGQVLTIYADGQQITGTGMWARPIIAPDPNL